MSRLDAVLFFLIFTVDSFGNGLFSSRQLFENTIYLPRCRFDEHILKNDGKFEKEISRSDFVFTGKVSNSNIFYKDNAILFSVTVRRYFKNVLKYPKSKEVRVLKMLNEGEGVKCRQPIRPKFTAIFIGRRLRNSNDADIFLAIGPVPVTLYNLDRVSAATKDEKHLRASITEDADEFSLKPRNPIFFKIFSLHFLKEGESVFAGMANT